MLTLRPRSFICLRPLPGGLISRPPLLTTVAFFVVVAFVLLAIVTPVYESHDSGPFDATIRFWWSRLSPVTYAPHRLREARGFFADSSGVFCPRPEDEPRAWLALATSEKADSLFSAVFDTANAAGRLYALVGLAAVGSPRLAGALARVNADTSRLLFWLGRHRGFEEGAVGPSVNADSLGSWAVILRRMTELDCGTAR